MKELLLEAFFTSDELDVINQQHIYVAVPTTKCIRGVLADGLDILIHERLGRHIAHFVMPVVVANVVANGVQ
jgi:hypothetical protein